MSSSAQCSHVPGTDDAAAANSPHTALSLSASVAPVSPPLAPPNASADEAHTQTESHADPNHTTALADLGLQGSSSPSLPSSQHDAPSNPATVAASAEPSSPPPKLLPVHPPAAASRRVAASSRPTKLGTRVAATSIAASASASRSKAPTSLNQVGSVKRPAAVTSAAPAAAAVSAASSKPIRAPANSNRVNAAAKAAVTKPVSALASPPLTASAKPAPTAAASSRSSSFGSTSTRVGTAAKPSIAASSSALGGRTGAVARPTSAAARQRRLPRAPVLNDSPASRLYSHALESIFMFLRLKQLRVAIRVSRSWSEAVAHLRSVDASIADLKLSALSARLHSPLSKHIGSVGSELTMPIIKLDTLQLIGRSMSCLHSLYCTLPPLRGAQLVLPPLLRRLTLKFTGHALTLAEVQAAIDSISRLEVECLDLNLPIHFAELRFAPLKSAARLTSLRLDMQLQWNQTLSPLQIMDLRGLSHLACMDVSGGLGQLLDGDCSQLRWQEVSYVHSVIQSDVQCLCKLPSLTRVSMRIHPRDLKLLAGLPALTALDLETTQSAPAPLFEIEPPMWARLRSLTLGGSHAVRELSELFLLTPLLESLSLFHNSDLTSLALFEHPTLIRSLRSLTITGCQLCHADELRHLHVLASLTALRLEHVFMPGPLPTALLAALTPPSVALPLLRSFWHDVGAELEYDEQYGTPVWEQESFGSFLQRTRARENMERTLKPRDD